MPITYTTRVTGLRVRDEGDLTKVVRVVDFIVTGEDGDIRYGINSSVEMRGEIDPENFSPMEDLTEAQVVGWLEADPNTLAGIKGNIEYFIGQKKAEMELAPAPVPWAQPVPLPPAPEPAVELSAAP